MVDLSTTYLGLTLKSPLVASASPLSEKVENVRRMEESGVSAVVMYSLFEEQILRESLQLDHFLNLGTESFAEALTYFPEMGRYTLGADVYIDRLHNIKQAVNIPVIGSLNGVSTGGWIDYASKIEQAGADALELNLYYLPTDPELTGSELEETYVQLVHDVKASLKIPLAVKLSPFFTSLPNLARRLVKAGADGLVLFNRFYQPDFDLEELTVVPNLELSTSSELRLPLRWIALLYGRIPADFAITSGVHTPEDMIKSIMAGASVTMVASEFLMKGIDRAAEMIAGFQDWLDEKEYVSVKQMKGSMSQQAVADPAAFERSNYMKVLNSYQS
jgi:dihydroorotate dehydrogenase (fumarate)